MTLLRSLARGCAMAAIAVALAGCATLSATSEPRRVVVDCPVGHEARTTARLFFGRNIGGAPGVSDADFGKFLDEEVTPRFPDGLTVIDGGGQWRGPDDVLVREASKIVFLVLPKVEPGAPRLNAVREAYKTRFRQDSVLLITQPACVSF